jgi:hypothetical protein
MHINRHICSNVKNSMTPEQKTAITYILQTCPPWPIREQLDEPWGALHDAIKNDAGNYIYAIVADRFADAQKIANNWFLLSEKTGIKNKQNRANTNQMIHVWEYFAMAPVVWGRVHGNA